MILNPTNALSWRRRLCGIALPVLGALLLQTLGATASEPRRFPRIVNGLETSDFPATGALLYSSFGSMSSAPPVCTGTLIGCQTFLTAAHCFGLDDFNQDLDPSHYFIFLQHAGFFAVDSIALHPDYATVSGGVVTAWGDAFADVAVAHLSSAVTAIPPRPLLSSDPYALIPEGGSLAGTIAGFGLSGGGNDDLGLKRWGHVAVADCPTQIEGETVGEKLLCWEFANPIGAAGEDSNTCGGDSGGPLFFEIDGEVQVAGITQAGSNFDCLPAGSIPDMSWDTSTYHYRSFIETELGSDSTTTCGGLPDVGSASAPILAFDGSLVSGGKSAEHSFAVGADTQALRVALNGIDDGFFDPDLYLRRGAPATTSSYDCADLKATPLGYCAESNSTQDTWYALIQNPGSGGGSYQLTVTQIPEPAAVLIGLFAIATLGLARRSR